VNVTDDEFQQYWDARPGLVERIEECFFFEWAPEAVASATGDSLEAVLWLYQQFRMAEDEAQSLIEKKSWGSNQ
jgi:hypothetical protein